MTKFEYMSELENLLLDIPIEEREEALKYYDDYFEDSDRGSIDEIVEELGTPSQIANIIKSDLYSNDNSFRDRGEFTENGYKNSSTEKRGYEISPELERVSHSDEHIEYYESDSNFSDDNKRQSNYNNADNKGYRENSNYNTDKSKNNSRSIIFIVIFSLLFFPVVLPLGISFFALLLGFAISALGVFIGIGAVAVVLTVVAAALFIVGIVNMLTAPFAGLLFIGGGLIVMSLSILFYILASLTFKIIPLMFKGTSKIINLLINGRREAKE